MHFSTLLLKNLLRRKMRSVLTLLGVALAVATMVTLRGASIGFEKSIRDTFERRSVDLVVVAAGVPDQLRSDLDERIGDQIGALPDVKTVMPGLIELVDVKKGETVLSSVVNGWHPESPMFYDITIVKGRRPEVGEKGVAVIGVTLAENLNKGVGDELEVQAEKFQIIGVFHSTNVFENGGAVLPLTELQELMSRKGSVTGFTIVLKDVPDKHAIIGRVQKEIEALTDADGKRHKISAQATRDHVAGVMPIQLAKGMAWLTSAVALVIGSISMLNTMLMSVLERTKEIGILRAVGWKQSRVMNMVFGEAAILGVGGAVAGVFIAMTMLNMLHAAPLTNGFISGELPSQALVEGVGLTLLVVLVGGIYPGWRASLLLPTEALRHE